MNRSAKWTSRVLVTCQTLLVVVGGFALTGAVISWLDAPTHRLQTGMGGYELARAMRAAYCADLSTAAEYNSERVQFDPEKLTQNPPSYSILPDTATDVPQGRLCEMADGTCICLIIERVGKEPFGKLKTIEVGEPGRGYGSAKEWQEQRRTIVDSLDLDQFNEAVRDHTPSVRVGMRLAEARYLLRFANDYSQVISLRYTWNGSIRYPEIPEPRFYENFILEGYCPTEKNVSVRIRHISIGPLPSIDSGNIGKPRVNVDQVTAPDGFVLTDQSLAIVGSVSLVLGITWRARTRGPHTSPENL